MRFSNSKYNPQIRLSPEELLEISQEINRAFTPIFSIEVAGPTCQYPLSPKEMLKISEEISLDFAPSASDNTQELVLLPVDPDHLHAYWNLGDDQPGSAQKNASDDQLTLRIYEESDDITDITQSKPYFDVAIDGTQSQKNIVLPKHGHHTTYSATLGKHSQNDDLAPLAYSNITCVPYGKETPRPVEDSQIVCKPTPPLITVNRETSVYKSKSASGQGNTQ
jgi:hypothetical protein